jgi:cell division protein FtsB
VPTGPRPTARPGAGPGRGKSRPRAQVRNAGTTAEPRAAAPEYGEAPAPERRRRSNLTTRAIALAVVLLVLTISFASSLRIYFGQAHEIASTKAEITSRQQRIVDLQAEVARWADSDYVKAQARDRLGWVVPGETGYQVVGADGKPLGGGSEIESETPPPAQAQPAWWSTLWGSVAAADKPAPVQAKPKVPKPISVHTKPNQVQPSASSSATPR